MNDPIIQLQAKLDKAKSTGTINKEIQDIQRQLDRLKLQAEIDPKSVSLLSRQLDQALGGKITVSGIEADETRIQKVGQQIGNTIAESMTGSVRKAGKEISSEIEKITEQIENSRPTYKATSRITEPIKTLAPAISLFKDSQNAGKRCTSVQISKYCQGFEYALHA